mmetsp:Transcript_48628/g.127071  ORF Transcript_48628/g.127071 Transcript_48628/m.127071 type:complete len:285 (+) Transcript_48628:190-1044(+)
MTQILRHARRISHQSGAAATHSPSASVAVIMPVQTMTGKMAPHRLASIITAGRKSMLSTRTNLSGGGACMQLASPARSAAEVASANLLTSGSKKHQQGSTVDASRKCLSSPPSCLSAKRSFTPSAVAYDSMPTNASHELRGKTACSASPKPSAEITSGQARGSYTWMARKALPGRCASVVAAQASTGPPMSDRVPPGGPKRAAHGRWPACARHTSKRRAIATGTSRKLQSLCISGTSARPIESAMYRAWTCALRCTAIAMTPRAVAAAHEALAQSMKVRIRGSP